MRIEIHSIPHRKIAVADIMPNPHRDLKENPVSAEKVEQLLESFERNGFWENIVVREHPEIDGKYQLAYGHGRLAALKSNKVEVDTITIPVAKLSDWEMYLAMVDENETQATITPGVVFENVGVGARLIEQYAKEASTPEQFTAHFGDTGAGAGSSNRGFGMIKASIERGEGPGRDVVMAMIPSARLHEKVVTEVLASIYGEARQQAATKQAQAKRHEAEAKRQRASATKDATRAKKLREQADRAQAKARSFEVEAAKIAKVGIDRNILLMLPSPKHMEAFGGVVRAQKILKDRHLEAAKMVKDEGWSTREMVKKLAAWWDWQSGAQAQRIRERASQKKREEMLKRMRGRDINSFVLGNARKALDTLALIDPVVDLFPFMNAASLTRFGKLVEDIQSKCATYASAGEAASREREIVINEQPKLLANTKGALS